MGWRSSPDLYTDPKTRNYESRWILLTDLLVVALMLVVLFWCLPTLIDWCQSLPDPAEELNRSEFVMLVQANPGVVGELLWSKRTAGIVLNAIFFGLILAVAFWVPKKLFSEKARRWRKKRSSKIVWICRILRWLAGTSLFTLIVVFGRLPEEVVSEVPIVGATLVFSDLFYKIIWLTIFIVLGVWMVMFLTIFGISAIKGRSIQLFILAVQTVEFLLTMGFGSYYHCSDVVFLAGLGVGASIVHMDLIMPIFREESTPWYMKIFSWLVVAGSILVLVAVCALAIYLVTWPYFAVASVAFA